MSIIIQDIWHEWEQDIEIIDYCKENNLEYSILNKDEILKTKGSVLFCNVDIISCLFNIPDTYDIKYNNFYKRKIERSKINDLIFKEKFFIKPVIDKLFDGIVINSIEELNIYKDIEVYTSEYINIISEYRLLIGRNKLYGYSIMKSNEIQLNEDFIKEIVQKTNDFLCIDIGFNDEIGWFIVEINTPYSIDQYDIHINDYMKFCIDSFKL